MYKSFSKLPIGDDCFKKALLNIHFFFFNISFESDTTSQLCFFCNGNINSIHYNGICKDNFEIYCLYQIVYKL